MENRRSLSEEDLIDVDLDEHDTSDLCCSTRFLMLVLATLCLTSVLSNILTFNFTVICMTNSLPIANGSNFTTMFDLPQTEEDGLWSILKKYLPYDATAPYIAEPTEEEEQEGFMATHRVATVSKNYTPHGVAQRESHWSSTQKSYFFGAIAVGALLAAFPVTVMISYFGSKKVFLIVGLINTIATFLSPFAVDIGDKYFLIARLLQGTALAACMPVIGSMTSAWAALDENGLFMGIATSFIQLAPVFTMPLSGALCVSHVGWPAVYYVHGAVSLTLLVLWTIFYTDSPVASCWIGDSELRHVTEGKAARILPNKSDDGGAVVAQGKPVVVPYGAILGTPAVWAVWIGTLANFLGVYLLILFASTFINKKLGYSVQDTGVLAAVPTLLQFVVKITVGPTSDKIKCLSDTVKVKLGNSVAFLSLSASLVALYFIPFEHHSQALVMLIAAATICGFNVAGFFKSATLVSRHHSYFVMSISQILMCVCMLVVPLIVQLLAPNNTDNEWHFVFLIHGGFLIAGNVFFCVYGSGEPAVWALESWENKWKPTLITIDENAPSGYAQTN